MIQVDLLIEVMENNEVMWNPRHVNYKNRCMKMKLWDQIAQEVGGSVYDCKKKWKGLRDSFFREHAKRFKEHEPPCERWQYYYKLQFLKECLRPRGSCDICIVDFKPDMTDTMDMTQNQVFGASQQTPSVPEMLSLEMGNLNNTNLNTTITHQANNTTMNGNNNLSPQQYKDSSGFSSASSAASHPKRNRQENIDLVENFLATMSNLNNYIAAPRKLELIDDEDGLFCRSLYKKLKKFPLQRKNQLKLQLLMMLNEEEEKVFS